MATHHPRKLVNYTVLDRTMITRVPQTWPAVLVPALVAAIFSTVLIGQVFDRIFAEKASGECCLRECDGST